MVDIFKASITTEVPNISENEKRLLHYFLNWVENPGNAERTWSEVKTEVIRIAQREMRRASKPDLSSRECSQQQQGAHSVAAARMQNNKDAGQQDDDKLQLAMTAVEDAGERLSIVLDVSRHQLERYNITGAEAMGHEGSGRQRSGEGRSPSMLVLGKNGNMPAWDRLPWAHTHCQQLSAQGRRASS
jgi:hypothetical protein